MGEDEGGEFNSHFQYSYHVISNEIEVPPPTNSEQDQFKSYENNWKNRK